MSCLHTVEELPLPQVWGQPALTRHTSVSPSKREGMAMMSVVASTWGINWRAASLGVQQPGSDDRAACASSKVISTAEADAGSCLAVLHIQHCGNGVGNNAERRCWAVCLSNGPLTAMATDMLACVIG